MQIALNQALSNLIVLYPTEKQIDDAIQLIKLGADPNHKNSDVTILFVASGSSHVSPSQIRTLLSLGCDPMMTNKSDETALNRAMGNYIAEIADVLFETTKINPNDYRFPKYDKPYQYGTYVSSACSTPTYGMFERYGKKQLELWKVLAKHGGKFSAKSNNKDGLEWYKTKNTNDALPQLVEWLENRIAEERKNDSSVDSETKLIINNKLEDAMRLMNEASALLQKLA